MTGMGASLEVEQPSMRRKKSRVKTQYSTVQYSTVQYSTVHTHVTLSPRSSDIYNLLIIQTPEEEAKIKAKKQLKLDIQVSR